VSTYAVPGNQCHSQALEVMRESGLEGAGESANAREYLPI